jgi:hypothetical protein
MEAVNPAEVEKRACKQGDWATFSQSPGTIFQLITHGDAIH